MQGLDEPHLPRHGHELLHRRHGRRRPAGDRCCYRRGAAQRSRAANTCCRASIRRSDLSRVNAGAGAWVDVDPILADALACALRAREDTGGLYDPTVLPALVAAGLRPLLRPARRAPSRRPSGRTAGMRRAGRARRGAPPRTPARRHRHRPRRDRQGLLGDAGGRGMREACPSLPGGARRPRRRHRRRGPAARRRAWRIGIADPRGAGAQLGVLALRGAGVATSGRDRRRFGPGAALHHLIDPATGAAGGAGSADGDGRRADRDGRRDERDRARDPARRAGRRLPRGAALAVGLARALRRRPSCGSATCRSSSPSRARGGGGMSTVAGISTAWLIARAAGFVAFGALTLSIWLGLAHEYAAPRHTAPARAARVAPHPRRHGARDARPARRGPALRPRHALRPASALVPFAAPWRPAAVAAGVVAGWLMVTLTASFRLRKLIGQRVWRRLHYASFAAFVLALCHALASGTDLAGIGGPILAVVAGGPVLCLTFLRILTPRAPVAGACAEPRAAHHAHPKRPREPGNELPDHHRPLGLQRLRRLRRHRSRPTSRSAPTASRSPRTPRATRRRRARRSGSARWARSRCSTRQESRSDEDRAGQCRDRGRRPRRRPLCRGAAGRRPAGPHPRARRRVERSLRAAGALEGRSHGRPPQGARSRCGRPGSGRRDASRCARAVRSRRSTSRPGS